MAGNGVIRAGAAGGLLRFAERLNIPVANTFMAKGVVPFSHPLWLGAVGLAGPRLRGLRFRPGRRDHFRRLRHGRVPPQPLEPRTRQADRPYRQRCRPKWTNTTCPTSRWSGDIGASLRRDRPRMAQPQRLSPGQSVAGDHGRAFRTCRRRQLSAEAAADRVGLAAGVRRRRRSWFATWAHTRSGWPACISPSSPTPASSPTVSPRWASPCRGPSPPSSPFPIGTVVAVTGDAGFMMNSQEIETALRIGTPMVIVIWNDNGYGLIKWHQLRRFGRSSHVRFRQSRLREVRREFRRQGISRRRRRRIDPDPPAGHRRQHGGGDRLPGGLFGEHEADRAVEQDGLSGVRGGFGSLSRRLTQRVSVSSEGC